MRIVVTGATSFIGQAVTMELAGRGHEVFAVVRPGSPGRKNLEGIKGVVIVSCTLQNIGDMAGGMDLDGQRAEAGGTDPDGQRAEADGTDPDGQRAEAGEIDGWIHLGWEGAGSANRQDSQVQARNISYAAEAMRTAHALGCRRFLFSGSQAEYGIYNTLMSEDCECHPVSEYGKDKLKVWETLSGEARELGMTYLHARIFSVYGPGDHPWSLISTAMDTFLGGGHIELGPCTQMWNFLYVTDAARAIAGLLLAKAPDGVYNVAGEDTRPLREYVEELHRLCGKKGTFVYGKRPPNAEGVISLMPDTGKLRCATGFRQEISFSQGIGEMLNRLKEADT